MALILIFQVASLKSALFFFTDVYKKFHKHFQITSRWLLSNYDFYLQVSELNKKLDEISLKDWIRPWSHCWKPQQKHNIVSKHVQFWNHSSRVFCYISRINATDFLIMLSPKILMSTIFLWFSTFFGCRLCTRLVFSPSFLLLFKNFFFLNRTVLDLEFYWPPKLWFDPFLLETCHIVIELLIVFVFSRLSLTMFYFRERFFCTKFCFLFLVAILL